MDEYLKLLTVERGDAGIRLRSPAKINLFLEPLRKRPDGFHEIVTVMQTVDLCDEVAIERRPDGIEIECDEPGVPTGPENLVWRAAEAFAEESDSAPGVRIALTKRIPHGGGLGGGSSNAAITLLGLNELYGRPFDRQRLAKLAARLGSDVAFFLWGGTALCEGRGERVQPLTAAPEFWVVLIMPGIHVATGAVYEALNLSLTRRYSVCKLLQLINGESVEALVGQLHNGLAETVFRAYPALQRIWEEVLEEKLPYAQLSGSGSTLYGICRTEAEAVEVSGRLRRRLDGEIRLVVVRNRLASA